MQEAVSLPPTSSPESTHFKLQDGTPAQVNALRCSPFSDGMLVAVSEDGKITVIDLEEG